MPAAPNYLDPHTLAAIGPIDLRARMIVEGLMQGQHRSPYQGFSIEFAQHRQYAPGDDTRFLDWKVYGKTDKLYLKQYHKETNLDMLLLVDVSGSMGYGSVNSREATPRRSWRKFDHAATLAAAMAHLALRQQDRVGLTLFSSGIEQATRLSNARDHWRTITQMLSDVEFGTDTSVPVDRLNTNTGTQVSMPDTDLARVFDQVLAKLTQRSLVVIISDLFDRDEHGLERGLARLRHARHDVIILQTLDHAELEFPFRHAAQFVGLEGEGRLPIDPAALRDGYLVALKRHMANVEEIARRFQFDYLTLDTSESLGPPLGAFLARRAASVGK